MRQIVVNDVSFSLSEESQIQGKVRWHSNVRLSALIKFRMAMVIAFLGREELVGLFRCCVLATPRVLKALGASSTDVVAWSKRLLDLFEY